MEVKYLQTEAELSDNSRNQYKEDRQAQNTKSNGGTRNLLQEMVLSTLEISSTDISSHRSASINHPLQFLCKYANSLLDEETGELIEYLHLIKWPKFK